MVAARRLAHAVHADVVRVDLAGRAVDHLLLHLVVDVGVGHAAVQLAALVQGPAAQDVA